MKKIMMQRTRFGEVVAEFLPPSRTSRGANKVVIFCPGMPSAGSRTSLAEFFSKKGYWFFAPRYRGTWESGGKFLKASPEKDVLDIIDQLPRGFKDAYSGKAYKVTSPAITLLGASFGGAAVLLLSGDRRVRKVIAVSPVVDWRVRSKYESLEWLEKFTKRAFGEAYRFARGDWAKLKKGKFYNPATALAKIDAKKIVIIHAKDDLLVPFGSVKKFAEATGVRLVAFSKGGHLSSSLVATKPGLWKKIASE